MARISYPDSIDTAPAASQPFLTKVQGQLGSVPNLFRLVSTSPAALEGFLGLSGALGKGTLGAKTGERIALAVANVNHCTYCNSAHGYIAKNLVKLSDEEIEANRRGGSTDAAANAAVAFAKQVTETRGQVSAADLDVVRAAGFTDAQLVEIVAHVALNTLTNYVNEVFGTEVDFPVAAIAA